MDINPTLSFSSATIIARCHRACTGHAMAAQLCHSCVSVSFTHTKLCTGSMTTETNMYMSVAKGKYAPPLVSVYRAACAGLLCTEPLFWFHSDFRSRCLSALRYVTRCSVFAPLIEATHRNARYDAVHTSSILKSVVKQAHLHVVRL